nr:hypothetical protein [Tanacetum cinerariifolium]
MSLLFYLLQIVQIFLWIIDSGYSKHMTGNHALLTNFVDKFLGMVRFGNNDFAVIAGYGDVGLEVAFQKSTCFVRNEDGVDLLAGDRLSNLYTIALNEVASNSSTCLLAKASSSQSWLWHEYHLFSACEQGKIHGKHHKSKTNFASNKPLYLLHMDLCGPMRVQSINGKRYVLVVVDDYSRTPQQNGVVERRNRTLVEADVGKLKAKWDIGVFVDYSKESAAFRIYNKRTRKIHESMNIMKSSTMNVETQINEGVFHEVSESFQGESSSSSLNDDVQQSSEEVILPSSNTQSIPINVIPIGDEASTSQNVFNE